MIEGELQIKFIKYLLNLKALNYLRKENLIDDKTYEKSRVQLEKIAQS